MSVATREPAKTKKAATKAAKAKRSDEKPAAPALTIDDVVAMDLGALEAAYRAGTVPESMSALDGSSPGRMLAVVAASEIGPLAGALREFAASDSFPWAGKTFESTGPRSGRGINRVKILGDLFRFETRIDRSMIDGKPCILLDYAVKGNPFLIKRVHDELREVAPGLFIGPAMFVVAGKPRLLLYFAVDKTGD